VRQRAHLAEGRQRLATRDSLPPILQGIRAGPHARVAAPPLLRSSRRVDIRRSKVWIEMTSPARRRRAEVAIPELPEAAGLLAERVQTFSLTGTDAVRIREEPCDVAVTFFRDPSDTVLPASHPGGAPPEGSPGVAATAAPAAASLARSQGARPTGRVALPPFSTSFLSRYQISASFLWRRTGAPCSFRTGAMTASPSSPRAGCSPSVLPRKLDCACWRARRCCWARPDRAGETCT
jgi:hypothetical protein